MIDAGAASRLLLLLLLTATLLVSLPSLTTAHPILLHQRTISDGGDLDNALLIVTLDLRR